MQAIIEYLKGGDRRSIGQSNQAVKEVLRHPQKIKELMAAILINDPLIRMRAADALEKIAAIHPDWLNPYKRFLLGPLAEIEQHEVRWHTALLLSYANWSHIQSIKIFELLVKWFRSETKSAIVRVNCLQAMSNLAHSHPKLIGLVHAVVESACRDGSPAVKARCKKIILSMRRSA